MTDCLIIGYNDENFDAYEKMMRGMGTNHPDYRDLNINFLEYQGKSYRALDILTHFYNQGRQGDFRHFHNADLLWNVILYLGTYLHRRGFSFDYINLFQLEKDKLREKLLHGEIGAVVITTTVYTMVNPIDEMIAFVKQYNSKVKIIVGGPFISKQAERMDEQSLAMFFKYMNADFFVLNREGELALANILDALKHGKSFHAIKNIAYKDGGSYRINPIEQEYNPLEENMIDYSLFPKSAIGDTLNIRISKGCPYACAYCGFPLRSEKYHYLSVDYIERDLNAIQSIGAVKSLFFLDDSVNVPKSKFKDMLRMMIRNQYDFHWNCFLRCDQCDEETIELMQAAKCEGVFLGLESANETVLKNMNKTSRKEHFYKTIPLFKQAGMVVFTSIFIGFPGETLDTFHETIDFLRETGSDFYRPQLWYCDPITPVWQQREQFGLTGYNFAWSHATMDARTACDLTEKAFLILDDPVWAPDPGFNFSSVYYLKHLGMSVEQIKNFLRCFNAVVKQKILCPGKPEPDPVLIESLRQSCQFDRIAAPDCRPVELLSASRYIAAEEYWLDEFRSNSSLKELSNASQVAACREELPGQFLTRSLELDSGLVRKLYAVIGDNDVTSIVFLAFWLGVTYTVRPRKMRIAVPNGLGLVPLQVDVSESMTLTELLRAYHSKLSESEVHQPFVHHIFALNGIFQQSEPLFDLICYNANTIQNETDRWLDSLLEHQRQLPMLVQANNKQDRIIIQLRYTPEHGLERVGDICRQVVQLLQKFTADPEQTMADLIVVPLAVSNSLTGLAAKQFNF